MQKNTLEFEQSQQFFICNLATYEIKDFPGIGRSLILMKRISSAGHNPFSQSEESYMNDTPPPYDEFANIDYEDEASLLMYANNKGIPTNLNQVYGLKAGINHGQFLEQHESDFGYDYVLDRYEGLSYEKICSIDGNRGLLYPIKIFQEEIKKMKRVLRLKELSEDRANNDRGILVDDIDDSGSSYFNKWDAAIEVCSIISDELKEARISLWEGYEAEDKGGNPVFLKMYLVKNSKQALFATLLENISVKTSRCADNKCGKYFSVSHKGKIYCTPECGRRVSSRKAYHNRMNRNPDHGKTKRKR